MEKCLEFSAILGAVVSLIRLQSFAAYPRLDVFPCHRIRYNRLITQNLSSRKIRAILTIG